MASKKTTKSNNLEYILTVNSILDSSHDGTRPPVLLQKRVQSITRLGLRCLVRGCFVEVVILDQLCFYEKQICQKGTVKMKFLKFEITKFTVDRYLNRAMMKAASLMLVWWWMLLGTKESHVYTVVSSVQQLMGLCQSYFMYWRWYSAGDKNRGWKKELFIKMIESHIEIHMYLYIDRLTSKQINCQCCDSSRVKGSKSVMIMSNATFVKLNVSKTKVLVQVYTNSAQTAL